MRRITQVLLYFVEGLFLRAHGWTKVAKRRWLPPHDYEWTKKVALVHEHGHAINSQKKALGAEQHSQRILPHV
jgi:hypothetical protein